MKCVTSKIRACYCRFFRVVVVFVVWASLCGCKRQGVLVGAGAADGAAATGAGGGPRIVSMLPTATEILFELGLGERIVGVCDQCQWPPQTAFLPKLGGYLNPSTERILSLRPDIVFVYESQLQLGGALERQGARVVRLKTESMEDLYGAIEEIGEATGKENETLEMIGSIRSQIEEMRKRLEFSVFPFGAEMGGRGGVRRRLKAVVVVDRMPSSLQRLFVAAGGSYVGQLLEIAGGDNCFQDAVVSYPMVSFEAIVACRPEVIVDVRPLGRAAPGGEAERAAALWRASALGGQRGRGWRVVVLDPDPITIPGPRVVKSLSLLHKALYDDGND